jgi:tetratricopeptide (TPR) repeat protein
MWVPVLLLLLQTTDFSAEGLKALEARNYQAAAEAFGKAAAADPKDYYAHFHLGLSFTMMKKDAEALSEFRKTLELKPGLYEAELNAGIVLLRNRQPAEALDLLQKAAEQKPREYRPRYYLAEALLGAGESARAEAAFQTTLELDPKSAAAEAGLAHALAQQDKLAEAAPHFRRAAELDPGYRDLLLELAGLYEKANQTEQAAELYRQFPDQPAARERLGQLLLESKKYADAVPQLEAAYDKDATSANRLALASAYLFDRQLDKALPLLEKSVAAEPANYDIRMMYARALRDRKQYGNSAKQFYEAVKLKPDSRQAWNDLAAMLYMLASYQQAVAALDQARKLGEDTATNWYFRAISLDKLHDLKPAMESYQRFLAMSEGKHPDEEFKARQRIKVIQKELSKR